MYRSLTPWLPSTRGASQKLYDLLGPRTAKPLSSQCLTLGSRRHANRMLQLTPTWPHTHQGPFAPYVISTRPLRTASGRCKEAEEEKNPFYEKYGEKLDAVQGLAKYQVQARAKAVRMQHESEKQAFRPPSRPHRYSQYNLLTPPSLDSVMHVAMITDKSADEIGEIWREHHKTKDAVCAVIPKSVYNELILKALDCPYFLYPLPREEGYEFMFGQFSGHRCHFSSLIHYQTHQENAPIHLTLAHYIDLKDTKGIVLMAGEIDNNLLSSLDAQLLANQVQLYYCSEDPSRSTLLHNFNHDPNTFLYTDLIEQLQNSTIGTQTPPSAKKQT